MLDRPLPHPSLVRLIRAFGTDSNSTGDPDWRETISDPFLWPARYLLGQVVQCEISQSEGKKWTVNYQEQTPLSSHKILQIVYAILLIPIAIVGALIGIPIERRSHSHRSLYEQIHQQEQTESQAHSFRENQLEKALLLIDADQFNEALIPLEAFWTHYKNNVCGEEIYRLSKAISLLMLCYKNLNSPTQVDETFQYGLRLCESDNPHHHASYLSWLGDALEDPFPNHAKETYLLALEKEPNHLTTLLSLIQLYLKLNLKDEAKALYDQILPKFSGEFDTGLYETLFAAQK